MDHDNHNHGEYDNDNVNDYGKDKEDGTSQIMVPISAVMRANRFGETPLHFATMRGECTRTIELLSRAAPWSVEKRDDKFGMTPLHWLLARFVDVMHERFQRSFVMGCDDDNGDDDNGDGDGDGDDDGYNVLDDVEHEADGHGHGHARDVDNDNDDTGISNVDANDNDNDDTDDTFDLEYHKRTASIDPPVDYMRMRHILPDHDRLQDVLTDRVIQVLQRVRERHRRMLQNARSCPFQKESRSCPFKNDSYPVDLDPGLRGLEEEVVREEQAISLFWAKASSLLQAAAVAQSTCEHDVSNLHLSVSASASAAVRNNDDDDHDDHDDDNHISMLHSACSSPSPLAIVRLCVSLYPEQLLLRDSSGKLPLHHAACRVWDVREICRESSSASTGASNTPNIILNESTKVLELVLNSSSPEAAGVLDHEGRLPFHHAIDSALKVVVDRQYGTNARMDRDRGMDGSDDEALFSVIHVLRSMIRMKPETIEAKDGRTGLYPFMQVSAGATENIARYDSVKKTNSVTLSLAYSLLLENPSLATVGLWR